MPEALGDWTLNAASHHPPISSSPQNRGRNLAPLAAANGGLTGMQPVSAVVAVESEAGRASRASVQQPVTWHAAVRRLNELGIRQFRLEPGGQDSGFLFVCSFTAADNPRVTHRFEAEADEPLRAVEQVLQQIDAWQNR